MARAPKSAAVGWPTLATQAWWLGVESSWVIGLRCARLAGGGAEADSEAYRMVAEKWQAQAELATALATGRVGMEPQHIAAKTSGHYSKRVHANRKRLTRTPA